MSELENKVERKRPLKLKKDKKQHSKDPKIEKTKNKDLNENNSGSKSLLKKKKKKTKVPERNESTGDKLVLKKKKKSKVNENKESDLVVAATENLLKKRKKKSKIIDTNQATEDKAVSTSKKSKVPKNKEVSEDNSVFAVTEKFLNKKKEKREKKQQEGQNKKKAGLEKMLEDRLVEINAFFQDNSDMQDVKSKAKPNWFDAKIKNVVKTYLISVEKCDEEPTPQNVLNRSQNEKKLYRFFQKLSKHLGEDITVIKHWFFTTKKGILKSGLNSKADAETSSILKLQLLNKKLKAILKEATVTPVVKSDDSKPPIWFDEEFAKLVKIRNKAKRLMKLQPTEENTQAFKLAFKEVKSERKKRMKSVSTANGPHNKDKESKDTKKPRPIRQTGASFVKSKGKFGASNDRSPKNIPASNFKSHSFGSPNARSKNFPASNFKSQSFDSTNAKSNNHPAAKSPGFGASSVRSQNFGASMFGSTTPNKSNKHIKFDD